MTAPIYRRITYRQFLTGQIAEVTSGCNTYSIPGTGRVWMSHRHIAEAERRVRTGQNPDEFSLVLAPNKALGPKHNQPDWFCVVIEDAIADATEDSGEKTV